MISYMWNLKKTQDLNLIDTENGLVVARDGEGEPVGVGRNGEGGQRVQTSSYKINKSRGCNVGHCDYS